MTTLRELLNRQYDLQTTANEANEPDFQAVQLEVAYITAVGELANALDFTWAWRQNSVLDRPAAVSKAAKVLELALLREVLESGYSPDGDSEAALDKSVSEYHLHSAQYAQNALHLIPALVDSEISLPGIIASLKGVLTLIDRGESDLIHEYFQQSECRLEELKPAKPTSSLILPAGVK